MHHPINLAGVWMCRLEADGFEGTVECQLPGSLDENRIGRINDSAPVLAGLSRYVKYTGPATFTRAFEVPEGFPVGGSRLVLERVHWFSEVWVNGVLIGKRDSLSIPHEFALGDALKQGRNEVVLRIDNTVRIPIGRICHALTDWTQTNWLGVIGEMAILPGDIPEWRAWWSDEVLCVEGRCPSEKEVEVSLSGESSLEIQELIADDQGRFQARFASERLQKWSPDKPHVYHLEVKQGGYRSERTVGARSIRGMGKSIELNGEPIFLRGTLECCVFPLTGYPPTDVAAWLDLFKAAKEHGMNHVRFHSYCPPDAAFTAADTSGVLLQVELPLWTGTWAVSSDDSLLEYCRAEAHRILRCYRHHPSFAMFTLGNEIAFYGHEPTIDALVHELKEAYPEVIFNFSAHGTHLSKACDYYVQADNGKPGSENLPLRGSTWFGVGSRFDRDRPSTIVNCNAAAAQFDRPVISHEVGEWIVFPDVHNRGNYSGALEARNFAIIQEMLEARGMGDQSPAFTLASGRLSAALYKEEIETLLRTDGLAGYQLLGLSDFPGQGTATVGMLDAFWKPKGTIAAETMRQFCASTVPLVSFEKYVWLASEEFSGVASVFHFGAAIEAEFSWQASRESGEVVAQGSFPAKTFEGRGSEGVGEIRFSLEGIAGPERLTLSASSGAYSNQWSLWVFPGEVPTVDTSALHIAHYYRQDLVERLKAGESVWLQATPKSLWGGIPGRFAPAFWSPVHFKEQVGTCGALVDAAHPIFEHFPAEMHLEWHWWDVMVNSKSLILDPLPLEFRPIVQVIDRYERNHKLGTMFEARVGQGRLFVSVIDFSTIGENPVLRQLHCAVSRYLTSARFDPKFSISFDELSAIFEKEP